MARADGGDGLRQLGLDQVDLLQRRDEIGLVALDRGFRAGVARLRGLRVLHAAIAGGGEIGVALVLLAGEGLGGGVDLDGRLRRFDHGLLNVELRLLAGDGRLCRGHVGLGLFERDHEVAVVDPRQHLAGLDVLVVADQHLGQVARDLWRDGRVVSLYIGIVGGDEKAADGPVVPAIPGSAATARRLRRRPSTAAATGP